MCPSTVKYTAAVNFKKTKKKGHEMQNLVLKGEILKGFSEASLVLKGESHRKTCIIVNQLKAKLATWEEDEILSSVTET